MAEDIVKQLSDMLLETEKLNNEFLPLNQNLNPIKENLNKTLQELKEKAESSEDLADKVFYLNRYADLIKKVESIFDTHSKRLQQSLQTISRLSNTQLANMDSENQKEETQENTNSLLTPTQYNKIISILNENKNKE